MKDLKMNRQLGTKWFTFYTKIRPFFVCLAVFATINDFTQYTDIYLSNWWLLLSFAVSIAQPVLCIMVAIKSSGDYVQFVRFVKGVLLFEIIGIAYQQGVTQYINSEFNIGFAAIMFAICFIFSYFVWYRLNVKYFEKRINVIKPDPYEDDTVRVYVCSSCGYVGENFFKICPKCGKTEEEHICFEGTKDTNKIRFCRMCGNKLIENSKFCSKCGTAVKEE